MDIRPVDAGFAVAPQIKPSDMATLSSQGFEALVFNRPDNEEPGQPSAAELRAAAEAEGIAFHHIPVSGGQFSDAAIAAFKAVRCGTRGKLLAFCRTGTRSITLDALANPNGLSADELLGQAKKAGYDLSALRDRLGR